MYENEQSGKYEQILNSIISNNFAQAKHDQVPGIYCTFMELFNIQRVSRTSNRSVICIAIT